MIQKNRPIFQRKLSSADSLGITKEIELKELDEVIDVEPSNSSPGMLHVKAESEIEDEKLNSNCATIMHLFISFVGAGILGLPYAFRIGGFWCCIAIVPIVGIISSYCMLLIVSCKIKLQSEGKLIQGYGDIGFGVSGKAGATIVDFLVLLTQTAFCCAYLLFIGENAHNVVPAISKNIWILATFPGLAALVLYRHIKNLSPFALVADIANIFGIMVVLSTDVEIFEHDQEVSFIGDGNKQVTMASKYERHFKFIVSKIPYVFGVVLYCYEGMGVILHIHESMEHKSSFNMVLSFTMFLVTLVYLIFGILGYLAYGDSTKEIITLNLGNGTMTHLVQLALSIGLYFTYPLMMYPVFSIVERTKCVVSKSYRAKSIGRMVIVFLTISIAIGIPNFGDFISLVGAGACSALALVLPAYYYNVLYTTEISFIQKNFNYFIVILGIIFGVIGTLDAGHELVKKLF